MFCDRKISGFANVNRVIARVCGGGTLENMPRLCGALPEAKGKGGVVQIVNNQKYRNVKKVFLVLVAVLLASLPGICSKTGNSALNEGIINMTTATQTVNLGLFGSGTATIDWGDGTQPQTVELGYDTIRHAYSNTIQRRITITGL